MTRRQAANRKANLALGGEIFACPSCGSRDWALTESKIADKRTDIRERKRTRGLLFGAFIILMMVVVYVLAHWK